MAMFRTNSRTGPDRKLHLTVPAELADIDLNITIEPATSANGTNGAPKPDPESRRRLLDRILGTIDDPTFVRPSQDDFERREPLD